MYLFHQFINYIILSEEYQMLEQQKIFVYQFFEFLIKARYLYSLFQMKKEQLKAKYQASESFQKQMKKAEESYHLLFQRTLYSHLDDSFIVKYNQKGISQHDIYFIDAEQQARKAPNLDKLSCAFVKKIPKPTKNYIIVYFNHEDYSKGFTDLKTVLEIMPYNYLLFLQKVYLVEPTFFQKAGNFFVFGFVPKYLSSHIQNIVEHVELVLQLKIEKQQLLKYIPKRTKLRQTQSVEPPAIGTITTNQNSVKAKSKKYQLQEYQLGKNGLPQLFQVMIYYFQSHPQGLQAEGIFRVSASITEQNEVLQKIASKHYGCIEQIQNPHIVANLIKKFLADLKTPLIPFDIFHQLMDEQKLTAAFIQEQMKIFGSRYRPRLLTLMFLFQFMLTCVIPQANINKMNANNISICLAPCLMWAEQRSMKDILYAKKSVEVLNLMLNNFEQVFGTRKQQQKLYRESYLINKNRYIEQVLLSNSKQHILNENLVKCQTLDNQDSSKQRQSELIIQKTESREQQQNIQLDSDEQYLPIINIDVKKPLEIKQPQIKSKQISQIARQRAEKIQKKGIFTSKIGISKDIQERKKSWNQ